LAAASVAVVKSGWRRRAEPLLLEKGTHFQISLDGRDQAQPRVRVLAVAKGTSAALSSIVGGLPRWVVQERTQPAKMIHVQMLLLSAPQREL
jgi:hypothetical protein